MPKIPKILLILSLILVSHPCLAEKMPATLTPYFEANSIDFDVLEAPKNPQSAEKQQEVNQIIALQKSVTKAQIDAAKNQFAIEVDKFVSFVDPDLTAQKYPHFFNLLLKTRVTAQEVKDRMKDHWHSSHPYQVSKKVKALIQTDRFYSYPSGHASKLYVLSYVIGDLLPQRKEQFLTKTKEISQIRILIGEHFPSDIAAGQKLADIIYRKLLTNKEFQKDFAAAKKELNSYPTK